MSDPDGDLMRRVQAGDADALVRLVERFLRPLGSFFHRLGADPSLAEDCAQEVLWKIYRARDAWEPRARFATYLFSVARHHWIDVVRHRAVGPRTVSADAAESGAEDEAPLSARLAARGDPPSRGAEAKEVADAVREAVAALSDDLREVWSLAQGEALRYQEIAEILGIPVGTVKSRMHTAVRVLRERLRRAGFEP